MYSLVYFVVISLACFLAVLQWLLFHLSIHLVRCLLWAGGRFVRVGGYVVRLLLGVFANSGRFL